MVTHLFCGGKPARQAFFVQVRACFAQLAPERLQRRAGVCITKGEGLLNIRICEDPACADIEVVVRCRQLDDTVLSLLARLRVYDAKLTGERDGATYVLAAADVLYADTADKKTFLYTADAVYETPLRLYELEEQLAARDFVRAGKSVLLNFAHVAALRPDFGGRMRVTMSNGEVVVASRQYVPALKAKLGL